MAITILKRTLCCTLLTVGSPVFFGRPPGRGGRNFGGHVPSLGTACPAAITAPASPTLIFSFFFLKSNDTLLRIENQSKAFGRDGGN
ncbi:hypothetical protein, partial [Burkholderia gladioli]|uniref:hypothetical protein n=1 Tax=Burkholderia gladioli TaxID=28095 RepID=UPI0034DB5442